LKGRRRYSKAIYIACCNSKAGGKACSVAACFFQNPVLKGHAFWIDFSEPRLRGFSSGEHYLRSPTGLPVFM
jgi:hypothetical protein